MIIESRVLKHPQIIITILKNFPTLDPLVILLNSRVYYIENYKEIIAFLTVKKWKNITELGTVYTAPTFRKKGFAKKLIRYVSKKYSSMYLLCKKEIVPFYKKCGFSVTRSNKNTIEKRRELFNKCLSPIFRYPLVSMAKKKNFVTSIK